MPVTIAQSHARCIASSLACASITTVLVPGNDHAAAKPNPSPRQGVHDKADEFNRVQRGHQNMLESISSVIAATAVGGLRYPRVATGFALAYCVGNFFYLQGYSDMSKDVKGARYTHPLAALKMIGMLGSVVTATVACVTMMM